jgi:translation initiation factor IF-1
MVKNLGGNKAKKQARKGVVVGNSTVVQKVRYVEETGEMYAVVVTIFGGKFCQVMCDDGISRRCTIRRKFMMSRKGDNAIAVGTWAMVGLYDWEKRSDGSQTCDILEVYSTGEKEKLKQTVSAVTLKHIIAINRTFEGNNEIIFSDTLAECENTVFDENEVDENEVNENEVNENEVNENEAAADALAAAALAPYALAPYASYASSAKTTVKEDNDWMFDENDI